MTDQKPEAERIYSKASDWFRERYFANPKTADRENLIDLLSIEDEVRNNPRKPGEDIIDWVERVCVAAQIVPGPPEQRLPYKEPPAGRPVWATPSREPGSDDE